MAELEYFPDLPDARIFKEVHSRNKSTVGGIYNIHKHTHIGECIEKDIHLSSRPAYEYLTVASLRAPSLPVIVKQDLIFSISGCKYSHWLLFVCPINEPLPHNPRLLIQVAAGATSQGKTGHNHTYRAQIIPTLTSIHSLSLSLSLTLRESLSHLNIMKCFICCFDTFSSF